MQRIPEPELMDEFEQAQAYAAADFTEPNQRFVDFFTGEFPDFKRGAILDLGCGPGDIAMRLAMRLQGATVHGVDGARAMLDLAQAGLQRMPQLASRVRFIEGFLPSAALPLDRYDAVISNSLLHHLHEPQVLWRVIRDHAAPGAAVLVMDLFRPPTMDDARATVTRYAGEEREVLQRDFLNSLCAAFEPGEVRVQLEACGLGHLDVRTVSDRHLLVLGRMPA
jgi:2-polyprenyl-3-methyl-5-hydroxy-6-metoxy-1,4-benzoquinol methylase